MPRLQMFIYRAGSLLFRLIFHPAILVFAFVEPVQAQWSQPQREKLASEFESAVDRLDSSQFPNREKSASAALAQLDSVESFFRRQADTRNGQQWLKYLDLGPLREAIVSEDSAAQIASEAIDLRYRLVGTAPGLELSVLQNLRYDLERLVEAIRLSDSERAETLVARQLNAMAEKIREMGDNPSAEDVATLAAVLGLLDSAGQAPTVVEAAQTQFGRPNLAILVSEQTLQSAIDRGVHESRPVRDCILGTRIVGNASLHGATTADLLPSTGSVRVQVSLTASVFSQNTGYNGPVRLRTSATGNVFASRTLNISELGITAEPATVQASLNTRINAIEHKLRLVRRIARNKACQQKPQADRIALQKLRSQVGRQFVEQTDAASTTPIPDVFDTIGPLLTRLSLTEPTRTLGSTTEFAFVDATLRRPDQLAAITSRPPVTRTFDAAIQVHESFVDNALSPLLAGRTMREGDFANLIETAGFQMDALGKARSARVDPDDGASNREEEEDDDDETPFEIEFARLRPIIFEAREGTLRVGVRGVRFAQGSRELKKAIEITGNYLPATTSEGSAILVREGDVDVSFPGSGRRLTVSQTGLKRTIQKKFSDVFPEVLLDNSFAVPMTSRLESFRGRVFRPGWIDPRQGWLSVGVGAPAAGQ